MAQSMQTISMRQVQQNREARRPGGHQTSSRQLRKDQ